MLRLSAKKQEELESLISFLGNAIGNEAGLEGDQTIDPGLVADVVVLFDWDLDGGDRELLHLLVIELEKSLVPRQLLIERLDTQLLLDCNLIDGEVFNKKLKRVYTDSYFTLEKHSLLREQTQGFSKLIIEIMRALVPPLEIYWRMQSLVDINDLSKLRSTHIDRKCALLVENIHKLIGCFMLDPTRVLDLILDLFTENVQDHWYGLLLLL